MRGEGAGIYIALFVGAVVFVLVMWVALSYNLGGGIIDSSSIASSLTGIKDEILGGALGGAVTPVV